MADNTHTRPRRGRPARAVTQVTSKDDLLRMIQSTGTALLVQHALASGTRDHAPVPLPIISKILQGTCTLLVQCLSYQSATYCTAPSQPDSETQHVVPTGPIAAEPER